MSLLYNMDFNIIIKNWDLFYEDYAKFNSDISHFNKSQLYNHYVKHGRYEKRKILDDTKEYKLPTYTYTIIDKSITNKSIPNKCIINKYIDNNINNKYNKNIKLFFLNEDMIIEII
jgi:hypothetical protein